MGALVASFYAAGIEIEHLYKFQRHLKENIIWILLFRKWVLFWEEGEGIY